MRISDWSSDVGSSDLVALEHGGIEAQHATRHGVLGITVFELDGLLEQRLDLRLEFRSPEVRVLELELVDQVDAEVAVHRLVAQDVLVLLGGAGHRSEERRVGKEGVSKCRSRGW